MKEMLIEEEIAMLEHRLTSTQSQSASNLLGCMIDDVDTLLSSWNETAEKYPLTCCLTDEIETIQTLKRDIIHQAISTSYGMAQKLNKMIQLEKNKYTLKNRLLESTSEWQHMVLNAIELRRLHIIKRANFIIKHKLATCFNTSNELPNIYRP